MLRYKYNYFDRKGVVRHMQTFFDYAVQIGLKPHKVPLYETIYYGIIHGYAVTLYQFYYTGDMILSVNTTLPAPEDEAALFLSWNGSSLSFRISMPQMLQYVRNAVAKSKKIPVIGAT